MTKVDLSSKGLGAGGAIIISAWLIHKDNGAMTSLNLSNNKLVSYIGDGEYDHSGEVTGYLPSLTSVLKFYSRRYYRSC